MFLYAYKKNFDTPYPIKLESIVDKCFRLKNYKIIKEKENLYFDADISNIENVGVCGCKSAMLSYVISSTEPPIKESGSFSSLNEKKLSLILRKYPKDIQSTIFNISIQCANPD